MMHPNKICWQVVFTDPNGMHIMCGYATRQHACQLCFHFAGPNTEKFPMVSSAISHADPEVEQEFFSNTGCLRTLNLPCKGPDWRYYQVEIP